MATGKLTVLSKIIITAIVVGVIFLGIKLIGGTGLMKKLAPGDDSKDGASALSDEERANTIRVAVVTWGGYAGGQYFNEGFKASKESRYFKDYGINVEFKLMDDFNDSRNAWKSD